MIIVLPALIFAMYAQTKVNGTFQRYLGLLLPADLRVHR